jgi:FKBP-type peptidyl-prolyl cis-trans isomerase FklB
MTLRSNALGAVLLVATAGAALATPASLSDAANKAFLATNANKPGVTVVDRGIQYRVIKPGAGAQPSRSDCATVDYKGWLIDNTVFDQTQPGQHATFPVGGLIPGWTKALQMMHEGEEWELVIPSRLAYGEAGAGGVIPPNQTLVFDLTLIKVSKPPCQ